MPNPVPSLKFEREAWRSGALLVAGVDEVGVGPLAGPVTAAAIVLRPRRRLSWYQRVRDSKVLTAKVRDELALEIQATVPFGIGWATHEEIDRIGILPARRLCMLRALEALPERPDAIISDALSLPLEGVRPVIDGDALSIAVAGASVIAKVARDRVMAELDEQYPGWGFGQHKGYPTPEHRRLLQLNGPLPIHRRSYAPVAQRAFPW